MQGRVDRMVTAVLHEIERGIALARLPSRALSGAQQVEPFPSSLRLTHVTCTLELPLEAPERAISRVNVSFEIDASGAARLLGVTVVSVAGER